MAVRGEGGKQDGDNLRGRSSTESEGKITGIVCYTPEKRLPHQGRTDKVEINPTADTHSLG